MGEVNDYMCDYLGLAKYNADFWNGTVFRGKRKIKIWQLQRHDREYYKTTNRRKAGSISLWIEERRPINADTYHSIVLW